MRSMAAMMVICLIVGLLSLPATAADRTVVANGQSTYTIYCDAKAPKSVKRAATELQTYIAKATGVKLAIKNAADPAAPMICVGVNGASQAAGVDKDLPEYGFRIVTQDQNIYILGVDTPDGEEKWTSDGRTGTLLAACDFLEKVVNVRWLMPGEIGEDVPKLDKLVVGDLKIEESPSIKYRWLMALRDEHRDVPSWKIHNKVDIRAKGAGVNWGHSFNSYPLPETIKEHPEILAVTKAGTPVRMDKSHMMYCLTKPILFDLFARDLNATFDKNPKLLSNSMSPDEGADFCQCPDCTKLTTPPSEKWKDLGTGIPQHTEAVLRFYNEVAKRVGAKHPDRKIGAFIYQAYLEPLPEPIKMEPNIVFGVAMNTNYGFKLYKPSRQAIFQKFFDEWGKYGAEMGYYSYDTWMRNWFGVPLPPGRPMLKWNFPMYKRNKVQYLSYVGQEAWGYSGCHNWLVGKLMWNADADVDALYNEYLTRAYGAEAGAKIGRIYDLVDANLQKFIIEAKRGPDHEIDYAAAKAIYGPIWPEVEKLYLEALAATPEGTPQRVRLEMFGENMVQAHFHMWKSKLVPAEVAKASPLHMGTDDFEEWVAQKEKGIAIIPVSQWVRTYQYQSMPVLVPNWRPK